MTATWSEQPIAERIKDPEVMSACDRLLRALRGPEALAEVVEELQQRQYVRELERLTCKAWTVGVEADQIREAVETGIRMATM